MNNSYLVARPRPLSLYIYIYTLIPRLRAVGDYITNQD